MSAGPKTRLRELAAELGLSITTVSRALAGYPDVSPLTRQRVRGVADRLGYVPSRAGRMLVSGRTDFVGMVLPVFGGQLVDAFLGEFLAGLGEGLASGGRDLFLAPVPAGKSGFSVLKHIIEGARADAVVINRTEIDDARVRRLIDRQFPFVAHGRVLAETRPYAWFDTDGEAAFGEAVERLIALGHRRFGLLTIPEPFTFAELRRRGMEARLAEAGLRLPPDHVVAAPMSDRAAARAAADRLLSSADRPTAILGITDVQAIAVLEAAAGRSIAVPRELSVIGFDDVPVAAYASPALSTFDQEARQSAAIVADMIVGVIERRPGDVPSRLVRPRFVARGSHGSAPD